MGPESKYTRVGDEKVSGKEMHMEIFLIFFQTCLGEDMHARVAAIL